MQFEAKTEKQLIAETFWPQGVYEFEVMDARDQVSESSGVEMIMLKVRLSREGHEPITVSDWLMEKKPLKLRHASRACDLLKEYVKGSLNAEMFKGKKGKLRLAIDRQWGANVVRDYC